MNILEKIVGTKQQELESFPKTSVNTETLSRLAKELPERKKFFNALQNPPIGDVALIAEVKKASPSKGIIRPDFDPVAIARTYEEAGASCISVLTDSQYFQGSLEYLKEIRAAVGIPLLRKDFIIDPRQVEESLAAGADCILLIAAILNNQQMQELHDMAVSAGMDVLVEAHDELELERAWNIGARLIGVNNRDLKTFQVDLNVTTNLALKLKELASSEVGNSRNYMLVGESGIYTHEDVNTLRDGSAGAILVGESIMRSDDLKGKIRSLLLG